MHESQIMRLFGKERVADISEAERQFQEGIANFGLVEVRLHVFYFTNLQRCIQHSLLIEQECGQHRKISFLL